MKKTNAMTAMSANSATGKGRSIATGILATAFSAALMMPSAAFAITADEAANQDIDWAPAATQSIHGVTGDNVGNTEYWMQLEEESLKHISIDVPVKVTLAVNMDGSFCTPTALKNVIENDSEFPVNVSGMTLTAKGDADNPFVLEEATGFSALTADNIFNGTISSVALNETGDGVESAKQTIAFTQLGNYSANTAWGMQASDADGDAAAHEKTGDDCLFIQIDGEIANVSDYYFTAPINVFDITYTFEATDAALGAVDSPVMAD